MKQSFLTMRGAGPRRAGGAILALTLALMLLGGSAVAESATLSPTTGLPTDKPYRPVLVVIDYDTNARPAWNLSEADIVYEAVNWLPGYTRFLALYNDQHPEKVGPLRGARTYQAKIREAWDCPFVSWGGQSMPGTSIYDELPEEMHFDGTKLYMTDGKAQRALFGRTKEYINPHNAYVNLQALVENYWPVDAETGEPVECRVPNLLFSKTPSRGEESAVWLEIEYGDAEYRAVYSYNAKDRLYERRDGGGSKGIQVDGVTEKPIVASNVIVQYCNLTCFAGNAARPLIETTGGGVMWAFVNGRIIRGTWERDTLSDQTLYLDESGEQLKLLPGKTFIQIVPPDRTVTYWDIGGVMYQ